MNDGARGSTLLRSTVVAALGGLLFGFDTVVISGATSALKTVYGLTPGMLGVTVASALAGTVVGSAMAGGPADRYGRKASLQILAVLYVLTSIGCALAWNWPAFLIVRAIGGLAIEPWIEKPSMVTLLAWTTNTLLVSKLEVSPGSTTVSIPREPGGLGLMPALAPSSLTGLVTKSFSA